MLIWTLLKKDLLRARRKPGNYFVMLMLPIALTAIMGLTFSSSGDDEQGIPQIQVAMVDLDQDFLSGFIKVSFQDEQLSKLVQLHDVTEEEARQGLMDMDYSVMVIIPEGFTETYFSDAAQTKRLALVKNARQVILPSIVEDIFSVFVDGMNTLKLNAPDKLNFLRESIESDSTLTESSARIIADALGFRLTSEAPFFQPIINTYFKETAAEKVLEEAGSNAALFANLFTGISAFFLLFLANAAAGDIFVESARRTLGRFRALRFSLTPLLLSKGISAVAIVFISSLILFGVGGLIFGVPLRNPLFLLALCFTYSCFAAGLMTFLTNWTGNSTVSGTLNPILIILIGFFGGGMIPVQRLPEAIRDHISPMFPNYWFYKAMVDVQLGRESTWIVTSSMLLGAGLFLVMVAALMLDRRLSKGVR